MQDKIGKLYIVSTPIGNLEDMTYRAVRILKEADIIAAEDTRKAQILLVRYEIKGKKTVSHHVQNEHKTVDYLIREVVAGKKVALITEAGTPCVSDPGFLIVREAVKNGIDPEIIPGVSALTFAVAACGLPVEKFSFYGFLPPKSGARRRILEEILRDEKTAFIFESPYRIKKLFDEIIEVMPECNIAVIREATKLHEEVVRGKIKDVVLKFNEHNLKGEFVVAISTRHSGEI
jgi:16S rRNA (cytidine1402-2'-O)-methyltransferase